MKVLVINAGSSSLKYQLIDMDKEKLLAKGNFERIGEKESFVTHKVAPEKYVIKTPVMNHEEALKIVLEQLTHKDYGVIKDLKEINAVGHRAVHGGELFNKSVLVTDDVIEKMEELIPLAPLHNPAVVLGIRACQKAMPGVPMVAVFDTAFHQTMPKENYIYPIPYEYYEKYRIRKYGFHGTSHKFVSSRCAEILKRENDENLKIVTCHLGQGSSICAVDGGKSVDTSMGLTPLGGIPMVTRSGDLDPSVVTYIMKKENMIVEQVDSLLNKESGVMGVTGLAPDFRVIEQASNEGNERADLAMKMFKYSVASYVAKYAAAMGGIDAVVFTGGVGENQVNIRRDVCKQLEFMGVYIDEEANNMRGEEKRVSKPDSKVEVWVVPTNEELMIAKETQRLAKI